ncbi:MAG: hypothetical protein HY073_02420 [Deltaproteobacteria bacterium]|nr:hypothetical protein [Deltaproteobacteria bacterium]
MGAVALSQNDEQVLESLRKTLRCPSKSQVIHRALQELQVVVTRERLAREIERSVQKCSKADFKEHQGLSGSAYLHQDK